MLICRYFWLPNLRKLEVRNLICDFVRLDLRTPMHTMSGYPSSGRSAMEDLRFVDFHDARDGANLECLLRNVEALKRFVFVSNSSTVFEGLEEHRRPSIRGIAHGLVRHMAHVEDLVLSPRDGTYGTFLLREWYFDHCFTNLRSVALPKCLLDQDIARRSQCLLPDTLEELQIQLTMSVESCKGSGQANAAGDDNVTAVEWLAIAKIVSLPRLKRVVSWYQPCELDSPEMCVEAVGDPFQGCLPELRRLHRKFRDVQVKFEWVFVRLFKDTPFGERLNL